MRAAHTDVLRKANAAVRRELACFELSHRRLDQAAEIPPLIFRNRGLQVLDFRQMLSHKDDESDI